MLATSMIGLADDETTVHLGWRYDLFPAEMEEGCRLGGGMTYAASVALPVNVMTAKVTALVTSRRTAEEILRNLGLLPAPPPPPVALAQAPPQLDLPMT